MQIHDLKLKNPRKKRKTIGRGGKKGTYSGKGNKGQKARSGAHVSPLFEGGRSTLVDHMKKKRGFKSLNNKKQVVQIANLENKFKKDDIINLESLLKAGLISRKEIGNGVKIIGKEEIKIKLTIEKGILLSSSAKAAIEKAGGEIVA
jgi:large subunit ribosomal protein L15